jgi:hypothetical protein
VGDASDKPTRLLADFSIFEARRDYEMVSLDVVAEHGAGSANGRVIEAAGYVMAEITNEEDAGQEDEDDEEEEQSVYLRLGPILGVQVLYEPEREWVINHAPGWFNAEGVQGLYA